MITRSFIVILLVIAYITSFGQNQSGSIHVTVLDAETSQPVPFATVYLNQTTIGGSADDKGVVEVKNIPLGTYQLVISEIGHVTQQRKLVITGPQATYIAVKLVVRTLGVVTVLAKRDRKWRHQFKRFEKMFFGSAHFKQCEIVNPSALQFNVEGRNFIVDAKEPIKIENNYLGYNLDFTLKNCFFTAENFNITGNIRFEEKKGDERQIDRWKVHREQIYRGSPQHFFHTVLDSTLNTEGYRVFTDITGHDKIIRGSTLYANINKTIVPDTIAYRLSAGRNGMYNINFPDRLEVHYLRKPSNAFAYTDVAYAVSWMEVKKGTTVVISRSGNIQNPEDITLVGAMSNLRVADWLPLDYKYADEYQPDSIIAPRKKIALLEKPYVQTDRDYYYNGETIWFKGYMSYLVPVLKDTLSQSIYVELSDGSGKVVAERRYHMEDGKFRGDIAFGEKWLPGAYQLKAYTAWMLNFDRRLIFTKTVSLLADKEAVRIPGNYALSADTLSNIWLRTDKHLYSAREKITVKIDVFDSLEFPVVSDLSISVTDVEQAVPHRNEKSIATNYLYDEKQPNDIPTQLPYDIEYGIPFNGRFFLLKKPMPGTISVFQDSTKGSFGIVTDKEGRFKQNVLFNDTVNFYLQGITLANTRGRVEMDTSRVRCPRLTLEPLSLDIYTASLSNDERRLNLKGTNVLPEFFLKAKKIIPRNPIARTIGSGDYTVTGEWINEHSFQDVLAAIASRVPGCIYDPRGPAIRFTSGMFTGLSGGGKPLIVIDGVPADDIQIVSLPLRSIDYVDVLKWAMAAKYGARGAAGVIEIHTITSKQRALNDPTFNKNYLQHVKWVGYTTASKFASPDYGVPVNNEYYDYRATIYWSPSLVTDGKETTTVSFYAADAATRYRIVVEGVTSTGEPVHAEKIVSVVKGR